MENFPYRRNNKNHPSQILYKFKPRFAVPDSNENLIATVITKDVDYSEYDWVTDYYTEKARLMVTIDDPRSPYKLLSKVPTNLDETAAREWLYENGKEVNPFGFSRAVSVLSALGAKEVVFDPCAGWGDRALACESLGLKYLGVDPNPNLKGPYEEITNDFPNLRFINDAIEDVSIENGIADTVFTSPPFFNKEIYNKDDPKQSSNRYPQLEDWYEKFLKVMLEKSFAALKVGGNMGVYLANTKTVSSGVTVLSKYMNSFNGAEYKGTINMVNERRRHPLKVYVWTKTRVSTI